MELQSFVTVLINDFELSLTDVAAKKLRREACLVMLPTIEGEVEKPHYTYFVVCFEFSPLFKAASYEIMKF